MKALGNALTSAIAVWLAATAFVSNAQTVAPPKKAEPARVEVPDGAPALARDMTIDQTTASTLVRERAADAIAPDVATHERVWSEERIEGRLAVIRSGRTTTTDPSVGRYDRAASNGSKRLTPGMWELFRF